MYTQIFSRIALWAGKFSKIFARCARRQIFIQILENPQLPQGAGPLSGGMSGAGFRRASQGLRTGSASVESVGRIPGIVGLSKVKVKYGKCALRGAAQGARNLRRASGLWALWPVPVGCGPRVCAATQLLSAQLRRRAPPRTRSGAASRARTEPYELSSVG